MKRYIHASDDEWTEITNENLIEFLKSNGIDTTKSKYELKAITYERYEEGSRYVKKFTCPGDWLAYFSMLFHTVPNAATFNEHGYVLEDLEDFIAEGCTTVDAMKDHASSVWWGDGDDYILYLQNLNNGEYLYGPEEVEYEAEEEEWED